MIETKEDLRYYIECDRLANGVKNETFLKRVFQSLSPNLIVSFLVSLRNAEYYHNSKRICWLRRFVGGYYRLRLRHLSYKLGYSIPINVFGPGLSLPHFGTIVVNSKARVGKIVGYMFVLI